MLWIEYVRDLWPAGLGVGAGLAAVGGTMLRRQFVSRAELTALDHRVTTVEDVCRQTPTRQQIHEDVHAVSERMRGLEAQVDGVSKQLDTTNGLLNLLVRNVMSAK